MGTTKSIWLPGFPLPCRQGRVVDTGRGARELAGRRRRCPFARAGRAGQKVGAGHAIDRPIVHATAATAVIGRRVTRSGRFVGTPASAGRRAAGRTRSEMSAGTTFASASVSSERSSVATPVGPVAVMMADRCLSAEERSGSVRIVSAPLEVMTRRCPVVSTTTDTTAVTVAVDQMTTTTTTTTTTSTCTATAATDGRIGRAAQCGCRRPRLIAASTATGQQRLVVIRHQASIVETVLRGVSLGRRFNVHKRHCGTISSSASSATATDTVLARIRAIFTRKQFDTLDATISTRNRIKTKEIKMRIITPNGITMLCKM